MPVSLAPRPEDPSSIGASGVSSRSAFGKTGASGLPPVLLAQFEGPLELLLHLIREHKIDIADIPIAQITDRYLAFLQEMESLNLTIAGEFLVMAATLLEIKSRMLLPKAPREAAEEEEDGEDPRSELVRRLQDYQRFKALIGTLSEWEDARRQLFFRGQADYGDLYELPVAFGELSTQSLVGALMRVLTAAGANPHDNVSAVKREKLTLRLAMAALWRKVERCGNDGVIFEECFDLPLVRLNIVMIFLALLELLRMGRVTAVQESMLGEIRIRPASASETGVSGGQSVHSAMSGKGSLATAIEDTGQASQSEAHQE